MKSILSVGEATWDAFMFVSDVNVHCNLDKSKCEFCMNYATKITADDMKFSLGGNAANTAVSFRRLGIHSELYTMRGDDSIGEQIQHQLDKEGVDCKYVTVEPGPSSYATALVFQGERNLIIYHVPRNYRLPDFEAVDWIYLTSMGKAYMHAYEKVLELAKKTGAKISFNPGTYQLKAGIGSLAPILKLTEVLFVNTDEARQLTELSPKASFKELGEALYDLGPQIIAITDGPKGAYTFDGHNLTFCDTFPAKVVERTGAGDSYGSGFTAALLHGKDIGEAMRWGMANSAGVIQKIGPEEGLLTKEEMEESLNSNHQVVAKLVE
jgi:sugar/nucleoside kinase (ribokinase family)